uniref:Macaca fascicularis brain cDNA clone: QtrA-19041, similar to human arrestin domain containing 3 (ARRDC3), mRNA, RefSeq: NM_020801.1 n=1 Tax=Macaca fascicularis TaxID=9541 RepID=I7GB24_MACFA|nr:unnamed protein product [Macaca fascicularis]
MITSLKQIRNGHFPFFTFFFIFSEKDVNIWNYSQIAFCAAFLRQFKWNVERVFFIWLVFHYCICK